MIEGLILPGEYWQPAGTATLAGRKYLLWREPGKPGLRCRPDSEDWPVLD